LYKDRLIRIVSFFIIGAYGVYFFFHTSIYFHGENTGAQEPLTELNAMTNSVPLFLLK